MVRCDVLDWRLGQGNHYGDDGHAGFEQSKLRGKMAEVEECV